MVAGLAVVAALPFVILLADIGGGGADLTSWGAIGLIYAGPWGAAIALAGWLDRAAAAAVLLTVTGGVLLAMVGPQMTSLVSSSAAVPFAAGLLAPLLVLARLATGPAPQSSTPSRK
jgi:hypothetical protein